MFAYLLRRGTHPREAGARLRRLAAVLASAGCGLLASQDPPGPAHLADGH